MKYKQILVILIVILSVITTILFIKIRILDDYTSEFIDNSKINDEILLNRIDMLQGSLLSSYLYNGRHINYELLMLINQISDKGSIAQDSKLIFWFDINNCQECVIEGLRRIVEYKDIFPSFDIVLLTGEDNRRGSRHLLNFVKLEAECHYIREKCKPPVTDISSPCFLTVDLKNGVIRDFFIPLKQFPDLTIEYFNLQITKI